MNVWNQAPLVRLLLPFLTGIIAAIYLPFQFEYAVYLICSLALSISLIILVPKLNFSYRKSGWFGILVTISLFVFAYQLTILKTEKFDENHFSNYTDTTHYVYARLNEPSIEKEKSLKIFVEIKAVKQNDKWVSSNGKAMVYLKKDTHALQLKYGDEIIMKADFKEVPPPQNPGAFDYKSFLSFHHVYHQSYVKESNWVNTGINTGNPILRHSINLRNMLLKELSANQLHGDEFAVGAALLLGYVDKLDPEIISAYASTGALHVLSVSGLHVAIVFVVFNYLLFFLDKIKYGTLIKAALLILLLWFYAALTGLSPSVLRAATMFSFIIFAKTFKRNTNIYNTLAASAFFLILINPFLVMDVGFQLSYIAVIGIVYLQPKIYSWFEVNNWLLDQVWMITSVSVAAQIATFPLGLHYFHQFPNYFLISNFVVIPISTCIIYIGISFFAFAKITFLAKYLALTFGWSVWFLNYSVKLIESWPYALLTGISITVFETCLLYGCVIFLIYYFNKRNFKYLLSAISFAIIILCFQVLEQYKQHHQKKFIVYNIPKTSAIDFISSKKNILFTDTVFAKNERGLLFNVKHNWWDLGLNDSKIISSDIKTGELLIDNNMIQFYDERIAIVNEQGVVKNNESLNFRPLKVDYVIVSKNPHIRICDVLKIYHAGKIIFDSSNSEFRINKWKEECRNLNQNYYSVPDSGAFVMDI